MGELTFAVPTLFGLEGLCADEMRRLGISDVKAEMMRDARWDDWAARAKQVPR